MAKDNFLYTANDIVKNGCMLYNSQSNPAKFYLTIGRQKYRIHHGLVGVIIMLAGGGLIFSKNRDCQIIGEGLLGGGAALIEDDIKDFPWSLIA